MRSSINFLNAFRITLYLGFKFCRLFSTRLTFKFLLEILQNILFHCPVYMKKYTTMLRLPSAADA